MPSTLKAARVDVVVARLRRLNDGGTGPTWVPAWSSHVLEKQVSEIVSAADSQVDVLLCALWALLRQPDVRLSRVVANFVHEVVVLTFTRYRVAYDATDFGWMLDALEVGATPAQAYLAALALPTAGLERARAVIAGAMRGSDFEDEVRRLMVDE